MAVPPTALAGRRLAAHESALPGDHARAEVPRRILDAAVGALRGGRVPRRLDPRHRRGRRRRSRRRSTTTTPRRSTSSPSSSASATTTTRPPARRAVLEGGGAPDDQLRSFVVAHVTIHAEYAGARGRGQQRAALPPPELAAASLALRSQSEGLLLDVLDRGRATGDFLVDDMFLALAAIGAMGIRVASWIGSPRGLRGAGGGRHLRPVRAQHRRIGCPSGDVMDQPEPLDVPVRGGALRVLRFGNGPRTVLAAHGITATGISWRAVAEQMGDGWSLFAPDLRGRGGSADLPGPWGLANHAEDVLAVVDALGLELDVLAGQSMGAYVAVLAAARRPSVAPRVLLVDGGLPLPVPLEGIDPDEVLATTLGPALERLQMTFPDLDAYFDFWREHPALVSGVERPHRGLLRVRPRR